MRGQIFFISIVDISSWPQLCFEFILPIIVNTVSCSNKLNSKENAIFSIKNVFIVMFLCWGMFAERVGPIFWKKELKLFAMSSLLSILSPLIMKYDGNYFLLLHLLSNSLMVVPVCFIFDTYLLNFLFSSIYISLENAIVILEVFFSSVSYIGESKFVNLRRLYILSLNLIEFMMPMLIHGFFLCL